MTPLSRDQIPCPIQKTFPYGLGIAPLVFWASVWSGLAVLLHTVINLIDFRGQFIALSSPTSYPSTYDQQTYTLKATLHSLAPSTTTMGFLSRFTTIFGLILLSHACVPPSNHHLTMTPIPSNIILLKQVANMTVYYRGYSAHEHSVLSSNTRYSTTSPALPQDIVIEALVALVIVSIGLVLGAEQLKPISWSVWAGEIEKEGGGRNPYRSLEERPGFMDIRVSNGFGKWYCYFLWILYYVLGCFHGVLGLTVCLGEAEGICGLDSERRRKC